MKPKEEREDDHRIMKLFRGRCVINPAHKATEINEILPRSRSKQATIMKKNRVPLCHSCHHLYHWGGVTEEKMDRLYEYAVTRLNGFGVNLEEW